ILRQEDAPVLRRHDRRAAECDGRRRREEEVRMDHVRRESDLPQPEPRRLEVPDDRAPRRPVGVADPDDLRLLVAPVELDPRDLATSVEMDDAHRAPRRDRARVFAHEDPAHGVVRRGIRRRQVEHAQHEPGSSTRIRAVPYPRLFSEWRIRNTTVANRVVFAPTCPTWVADPYEGVFTDQAVAYYEERARAGCGLILIGGTIVDRQALYSEFNFPGLWSDGQVEGLARVAEAVHRHGCKLACQLLHVGLRAVPVLNKDPAYDFDAQWYLVAPSQVPPGEYPNAPMPKELEEHEIEEILGCFESAARRAIAAGLDGVEFHMSHGYLPWQFLSPLYNHRTDGWGGSYENRLRFPLEALARIRGAIGDEPFLGYRINSTSFWPGDLEMDDVKRIVADLETRADVDYVNLSAGVHHSFIHTPMTYEPGWERGYTKEVKEVSTKPVLLVGRI